MGDDGISPDSDLEKQDQTVILDFPQVLELAF